MKIQGIYKIRNCLNGKVYIGQSIDIKKRWNYHKNDVDNPKINHHLYNSIRCYGIHNFEFIILEEVKNILQLDEREQYWLDYYKSYDDEYGYNICKEAGSSRGCKPSEEAKKKSSDSHKKTQGTVEFRNKMSEKMKQVCVTKENKVKISEGLKRFYFNNSEAKKQNSERVKNLWKNPEYRKKVINARKGYSPSEKTIKKIVEARKWYRHSEEIKKLISEKVKQQWIKRKESKNILFLKNTG